MEINEILDDVSPYTICDLLNQFRTFYVPDFQRFYVWDTKNVEQLYDDINNGIFTKKKELFLGNSILKIDEDDVEIIDGQQRIVTFLILIRCMVNAPNISKYDKNNFLKILTNIRLKKGPKIELLEPTSLFFERYILRGEDVNSENQKIEPIVKIINAKNKLEAKVNKLTGEELNILSEYINKHVKIVVISPKHSEWEIYDSMNSKGVSLTDADKIKNFLFGQAKNKEEK